MLDGAHTKNIQYGTFYATHGVLNVGLTSSGFASGDGILSAIVPTIKILEFVAGSIFANAVVDTSVHLDISGLRLSKVLVMTPSWAPW